MKALILAAGYAVRLYPLTKQYPKPLLKLGNKAIIDYIIDKIECLDEIDEVIIVTNSKYFSVFKKWAAKKKTAKKISLIDDLTSTPQDKRGAIGDMDFSINAAKIEDDLLVIGGDNLFKGSLRDFLSFTKKIKTYPVIGIYDIKDLGQADKYGVIRLNKENKIIDFKEKPKVPESSLVAMCLYYFPKSKLKLIKKYLDSKKNKSDATGFYIDWLSRNYSVYGFVFKEQWYDIGDHGFLNKAKEEFINKL
ncbi:MAG: nucleotidyltransferase family protein [Candidatus Omnitrophota bacterium]